MIDERALVVEPEWREGAACLPYPAILFFGQDETESPAERRAREDQAKIVCETCCVRGECLEYAVVTREQYGIWGGLTELERKAYARAQGRKAARV
jgi:WhiB family redox-sensing transcriptional regulator